MIIIRALGNPGPLGIEKETSVGVMEGLVLPNAGHG